VTLFSLFCQLQKGTLLQTKKSKQLYHIEVEFKNGLTKLVKVKAVNRSTAEKRAMKFHPSAVRVKRDVA
jgi:hypothetical protein